MSKEKFNKGQQEQKRSARVFSSGGISMSADVLEKLSKIKDRPKKGPKPESVGAAAADLPDVDNPETEKDASASVSEIIPEKNIADEGKKEEIMPENEKVGFSFSQSFIDKYTNGGKDKKAVKALEKHQAGMEKYINEKFDGIKYDENLYAKGYFESLKKKPEKLIKEYYTDLEIREKERKKEFAGVVENEFKDIPKRPEKKAEEKTEPKKEKRKDFLVEKTFKKVKGNIVSEVEKLKDKMLKKVEIENSREKLRKIENYLISFETMLEELDKDGGFQRNISEENKQELRDFMKETVEKANVEIKSDFEERKKEKKSAKKFKFAEPEKIPDETKDEFSNKDLWNAGNIADELSDAEKNSAKKESREEQAEKEEIEKIAREFYQNLEKESDWDGYDESQKRETLRIQSEVFLRKILEESDFFVDEAEKLSKKICREIIKEK